MILAPRSGLPTPAGGEPGRGLQYTGKAVEIAAGKVYSVCSRWRWRTTPKSCFVLDRLDLAYIAAQEGNSLAIELGHGAGWHLVTMAYVEAIRGDERKAREHAGSALAIAQRSGHTYLEAGARASVGLLEITLGRPADGRGDSARDNRSGAHRSHLRRDGRTSVRRRRGRRAGRATGRRWRGAPGRLARLGPTSPSDANRSLVARAEALLERRTPDEAFAEAVRLSRGLTPFERSRTELVYGEWLRRQRRPSEARAHLRDAADLFRSLGALPWAERAENELRATGETARKRDPSTLDQLTPQELQIAGLVASGLTNREIASQLFLSPRTVEYHLRKVFTKLGLASRTELIRRRDIPPAAA